MFFKSLTRAFWVLYDNLFKGILVNIIMFLLIFVPLYFLWKAGFYVPTFLIIGAMWHIFAVSIMYFFSKVIRGEDHKGMWTEIFTGFKTFWYKGLGVFASVIIMALLAYVAFNFYRANAKSVWALVAGGIGIWLTFTFVLMQIYMIPIMIMDEKKRFFASFKKSLIMVLSAPFSSIFLVAVIMYFDLLYWPLAIWFGGPHVGPVIYVTMFPMFLMPFVSLIFIMLLQLNATILIYEKHNIYPNLKETWEDRDLANLFRPWEVK